MRSCCHQSVHAFTSRYHSTLLGCTFLHWRYFCMIFYTHDSVSLEWRFVSLHSMEQVMHGFHSDSCKIKNSTIYQQENLSSISYYEHTGQGCIFLAVSYVHYYFRKIWLSLGCDSSLPWVVRLTRNLIHEYLFLKIPSKAITITDSQKSYTLILY